jgi:hypothetical protein
VRRGETPRFFAGDATRMTRFDLYTTVHKGLRAGLFRALELAAAVTRILGFLAEHAEHEDDHVLPSLARHCPELAADLRSDHARTHGLEVELAQLVERLGGAGATERGSLGRRIADRLANLAAEHLRHMGVEESQGNRVLWANLGDGELLAIHGRIVGSVPPPRMAQWMELMLPTMSSSERVELVGGLRAALPVPVFVQVTAPARAVLGRDAWSAIEASLASPLAVHGGVA